MLKSTTRREKLKIDGGGGSVMGMATFWGNSRPMSLIAVVFGTVLVYSILTSLSFVFQYGYQDAVSPSRKDALVTESALLHMQSHSATAAMTTTEKSQVPKRSRSTTLDKVDKRTETATAPNAKKSKGKAKPAQTTTTPDTTAQDESEANSDEPEQDEIKEGSPDISRKTGTSKAALQAKAAQTITAPDATVQDETIEKIDKRTETATALNAKKSKGKAKPAQTTTAPDATKQDESETNSVEPEQDEMREGSPKISRKTGTSKAALERAAAAAMQKYSGPHTSVPGAVDAALMPDGSTFSACIMVMDDNHRLVEWIAYHYFVMNLRYLVILPDRFSNYWPKPILDKWRKYMVIEEWKDETFMDEAHTKRAYDFLEVRNTTSRKRKQSYHMQRQSHFYRYCAMHMQAKNRTWVSFHDVDEYYVINSETVKNATERMREPGSVLKVLNTVQKIVEPLFKLTNITLTKHHMTPCVTTYRTRYGAVESTEKELRRGVPDFVDPKRFETLRWRHYTPADVQVPQVGKSLLDVSKIPDLENKHYVDRPLTPFSPHKMLPMCVHPFLEKNAFIRVNHYIGSWEYYSFRSNDGRKGANKNRDRWEKDSAVKGGKSGDEIRPWIDGFVGVFGESESMYLLEGSGLDENYTATIDLSWVLPGKRKKRLNLTDTQ
jgi:hypothetical protein